MRNLVKSFASSSWRLSVSGAEQLLKLSTRPVTAPLEALGGTIGSLASGLEARLDKALQSTVRSGDELQEKTVDLSYDLLTAKPLRAGLESIGLLPKELGNGLQVQPELEYLEALNDAGPYTRSLAAVLLTTIYANLNRDPEGIERFSGYLERYEKKITGPQKALYLACLALLRAGHAQKVPIWELWTVLPEILRLLEELAEAKRLTETAPDFSDNLEKIIVRWISGLLNAQLPRPFGSRQTALDDLTWVEETINASIERKAQAYHFLREAYFNLAVIYRARGEEEKAKRYLELSRFETFDKQEIILATPYSADPNGLRVGIQRVNEPVREQHPGKVFTVSGFDMSEFNFVITADGSQLLAIDAGTREETAKGAYDFLSDYYRGTYGRELPPLTAFFATHDHWDHVGGHHYYQRLNSDLELYSRFGFRAVRQQSVEQPPPFEWYLGESFKVSNVSTYEPTVVVGKDPIGEERVLRVGGLEHKVFDTTMGGSRVQLILPWGGGGETEDGMMIFFPDYGVLHVGDFMVPWIGTPYLIEGNFEAFFGSLDLIQALEPCPRSLLHGHEPLTQFFGDVDVAVQFKPHLDWLFQETLRHIFARKNLTQIQELNLFPKALLDPSQSRSQLPYIVFREVVIDRIYRQHIGYWGPQLQGVDYLTDEEISGGLSRYWNLSEAALASGIERMIDNGDHELAGRTVDWALLRHPDSQRLQEAKNLAYLKLKEKWQNMNPFKLVMYSEHIDDPTRQIE